MNGKSGKSGTQKEQCDKAVQSGLGSIRGQAGENWYSLAVTGFVKLDKGDTCTVAPFVYHSHGFTLQHESGFSMTLVHPM